MNKSSKAVALLLVHVSFFVLLGCTKPDSDPAHVAPEEPEPIARTEFTDRVENFFEYEPLQQGKPSQFRIHLTDLSDGSPVEKANVSLTVRQKNSSDTVVQTTAKVGKVTGIYVAEVTVPKAGEYDIEFQIKNDKLNERLPLGDFKVE